ncbi:MAG: hypothetical protein GC145_11335 [Caulobacter sp.]|nr:hypothetical protein [Caulobacter sp.]
MNVLGQSALTITFVASLLCSGCDNRRHAEETLEQWRSGAGAVSDPAVDYDIALKGHAVTVVARNRSGAPVCVQTALWPDRDLGYDGFFIQTPQGRARFTGMVYGIIGPGKVHVLAPDGALTATVDLARYYDLGQNAQITLIEFYAPFFPCPTKTAESDGS